MIEATEGREENPKGREEEAEAEESVGRSRVVDAEPDEDEMVATVVGMVKELIDNKRD